MNKTIQIKCKGSGVLSIDKLIQLQGALKKIDRESLEKLKKNIIKKGFSFPIFIWESSKGENYIIDGHQRLKALNELKEEEYIINEVPIVQIIAKNKKEAKMKLLIASSTYGIIDEKGLSEYVQLLNIDEIIEYVQLPIEIYDANNLIDFKEFKRKEAEDFIDLIDRFENKKGNSIKNKKWFVIEYFQDEETYNKVIKILKKHNALKTDHQIDNRVFYKMLKELK